MSHIVTIQTKIRDVQALDAACRRLQLTGPVAGKARLFSGEAEGLIVELPGWRYPVVVDPKMGSIQYDNYNGKWGEQRQLDRLLQAYAVEKARLEARRSGHSVTEQQLEDGSIRLRVEVST